ncbi:MAG: hypothetical protein H5U08_12860 [Thermogutta sp.]|uniref:hypothetical protein n=1 Tax=Thermogutta sp. TaxID=1962930 RepID=UPI0019AE1E89|nr:hypothetical protein [Thermogutta sp.]MBC7353245.1 hypothetical protein [Thermogutta sp.]
MAKKDHGTTMLYQRRKSIWLIWTAFLAVWGALLPLGGEAGQLDWRLVPKNWRWIVHLDVDAIRQSPGAGRVFERFWQRSPNRTEIEAAAALAEADLKKDLHGVTFVGMGFDPKKGAVLVQMKVNQQRLLGFIKTNPEYATRTVAGITIHRWHDAGEKAFLHGCFLPGDWVVLSREGDLVDEIATSAAKEMGRDTAEPFYQIREGTYLEIHARNTDQLPVQFMSPLIRRSRRLTAALGEHQGQAFVQATFEVEGADTALNVRDALVGLLAIGKLHYADEPHYVALLDHAKVFASENRTTLVWTAPTDDVLDVLAKLVPWLREK